MKTRPTTLRPYKPRPAKMNFWVALALLVTGQECQEAQSLARRAYEERRYDQAALHFDARGDRVWSERAAAPRARPGAAARAAARRRADDARPHPG